MVGALLIIGGLGAIQTAMVIGALPFSMVMALMGIALIKAIYKDSIREKAGVEIIYDPSAMISILIIVLSRNNISLEIEIQGIDG